MEQQKNVLWIAHRTSIIIYMALAYYIFCDVFGGLALLAWWVGTILPFPSINFSYSLVGLTMIASAILTTLPLIPMTQNVQKKQLWICTALTYTFICYIYTVVFTEDLWTALISERAGVLLYLLGQLELLFLLRKAWQKIRIFILLADIIFLIGFVTFCGGGMTFNVNHVTVSILVKFLKIITGL